MTPRYNTSSIRSYASYFSLLFDQDMAADLKPVEAAGLKVFDLNTWSGIDKFVAKVRHPASDVTSPCWTGDGSGGPGTLCSGQNQYLFWDTAHPTAEGHLLIAEDACNAIGGCNVVAAGSPFVAGDPPSAIPETSTWAMMLLGLAALGVLGARKVHAASAG